MIITVVLNVGRENFKRYPVVVDSEHLVEFICLLEKNSRVTQYKIADPQSGFYNESNIEYNNMAGFLFPAGKLVPEFLDYKEYILQLVRDRYPIGRKVCFIDRERMYIKSGRVYGQIKNYTEDGEIRISYGKNNARYVCIMPDDISGYNNGYSMFFTSGSTKI